MILIQSGLTVHRTYPQISYVQLLVLNTHFSLFNGYKTAWKGIVVIFPVFIPTNGDLKMFKLSEVASFPSLQVPPYLFL